MRGSFSDEGIVLRRQALGDSDRIVVLLTREHGKLSVVARGVRRPRARNAAGLELLERSTMMLIPGRSLHVLAQVRPSGTAPVTADPIRMGCAAVAAETVDALVEEGHPEPVLFELLAEVASRLASVSANPHSELMLFLLAVCAEQGFLPQLERCAVCDRPLEDRDGWFQARWGGVVQDGCGREPGLHCSATALRVLRLLARGDAGTVRRLRWGPGLQAEVEGIVLVHLQQQMDRQLRSAAVLPELA